MSNQNNQIAIVAILRELGVPLSVATKNDRLAIQKAIYLSQVAGADLGYRYSWYLNGPYCSPLADDYYEAAEQGNALARFSASQSLKRKLIPVSEVLKARPKEVDLVHWLEATASLDYMKRVQKRTVPDAAAACAREKPHLKTVIAAAETALANAGL